MGFVHAYGTDAWETEAYHFPFSTNLRYYHTNVRQKADLTTFGNTYGIIWVTNKRLSGTKLGASSQATKPCKIRGFCQQ